ncbi:MAG: hypothetical protein K2X63_02265, partial [Burkholderiaceae bacterium]|nr:hypothetical protein [Burkholderiaceae bacterium]
TRPNYFLQHFSMTNQEKFLSYLRHYESKNLDQISEMFSEDVTLRDWRICVGGKVAAVAETKANFEAAQSIQIQPLHLYETSSAVAGELKILVDGKVELFVVDVVEFDAGGKIKAIRAFLGRGDE